MHPVAASASFFALLWTLVDPAFAPSLNAFLNLATIVALYFINRQSKVAREDIKAKVEEVHGTVANAAIAAAAAAQTASEVARITKEIGGAMRHTAVPSDTEKP